MNSSNYVTDSDTFLRLFHALITDDILPILTKSMENEEFGDKKTFGRQLNLWSKVAELHNDPSFLPASLFLPTLHNDFKVVRSIAAPKEKEKMQNLFELFTKTKSQMLSLRQFVFRKEKVAGTAVPTIVSLMRKADSSERFGPIRAFPPAVLYLWHLEDAYQWIPSKLKGIGERSRYLEKSGIHKPGETEIDPVEENEFLIKCMRIENAQEALVRLQDAELHHSNMAKDFADMITKMHTVGGKQHDLLLKVVNDIIERVDASKKRTIAIESLIFIRQS